MICIINCTCIHVGVNITMGPLYENDIHTSAIYHCEYRLDKQEHHHKWHSVEVHDLSTRPNVRRLQSSWISTVSSTRISFYSNIHHPAMARPHQTIFKRSIITFQFKIPPDFKACSIATSRAQSYWPKSINVLYNMIPILWDPLQLFAPA